MPDEAATPTILLDQARALVQTEEARFTSSQSRATALLAVAGVIAGLGGGILGGLDNRDYHLQVRIDGIEFSLILVAAVIFGAVAIVTLLWSGATALGVLRKEPEKESKAKELSEILKTQFPTMLDLAPADSARALLSLLSGQHGAIRKINKQTNEALKQAGRLLGIAVAFGLLLSVLVLFGTTARHQKVYVVEEAGTENARPDQEPR